MTLSSHILKWQSLDLYTSWRIFTQPNFPDTRPWNSWPERCSLRIR